MAATIANTPAIAQEVFAEAHPSMAGTAPPRLPLERLAPRGDREELRA